MIEDAKETKLCPTSKFWAVHNADTFSFCFFFLFFFFVFFSRNSETKDFNISTENRSNVREHRNMKIFFFFFFLILGNKSTRSFEPRSEKTCLSYANNTVADQPARPRSLISAFVVRCQDSIIPLLAIAEISRP